MATTTELVAEINSTLNASTYDFGAITPPANSLVTVIAAATGTVLGAITDTGAVLTWTQRYFLATTIAYVVYTAPVDSSPSSITIRYDCTGDEATGCNATAFVTTGYDTAIPVQQTVVSASGASATTPAVTLGAARKVANTTLGVAFNVTSPAGIAEPTGWTEVTDVGHSIPTVGAEAAFRDGGETNATVTWGDTSPSSWRAIVVEIAKKRADITGTATASITEADVVAGGKTIIITLTGDTWIAAGAASFDLQRLNIIQGLDSAQSEALGWNLQVRDTEVATAVVRTSDTVVTITLSASALYNITAQETITVTVPGTALTSGNELESTPTFTVDITAAAGQPYSKRLGGIPFMAQNRGVW